MNLCKLGDLLESLPEAHRQALTIALDTNYPDGGLSDASLAHEITMAGFPISYNMVNHHRRGVCRCRRGEQ